MDLLKPWRWFAPLLAYQTSPLSWAALRIAQGEIGQGEFGDTNNRTKYAVNARYGPWCARFVCWCYEEAAEELQVQLPFKPTGSAKRLYKRVGRAGAFFSEPELARPGDLICWHRGRQGSWQGHIGFVEHLERSGVIATIEGNVGRYPALVARFRHDVSYERLVGFARLG